MKTQLLCTFTKKNKLDDIISLIKETYDIVFGKIFILQEEKTETTKLLCTYNINNFQKNIILPNTISLHRKKDSNTLYTINGLNELIRLLNDGDLDKTFPIPWNNYINTVILSDEEGLKKIKTRIFSVVKF